MATPQNRLEIVEAKLMPPGLDGPHDDRPTYHLFLDRGFREAPHTPAFFKVLRTEERPNLRLVIYKLREEFIPDCSENLRPKPDLMD